MAFGGPKDDFWVVPHVFASVLSINKLYCYASVGGGRLAAYFQLNSYLLNMRNVFTDLVSLMLLDPC